MLFSLFCPKPSFKALSISCLRSSAARLAWRAAAFLSSCILLSVVPAAKQPSVPGKDERSGLLLLLVLPLPPLPLLPPSCGTPSRSCATHSRAAGSHAPPGATAAPNLGPRAVRPTRNHRHRQRSAQSCRSTLARAHCSLERGKRLRANSR